ncbi:MAG: hypothetical protein MJH10_10845 [Epibacterium sp.]|nr:hypothetical protein [Epibacterium sp.]NQX74040.1 hypothetical protein [Epibacterium sp.]
MEELSLSTKKTILYCYISSRMCTEEISLRLGVPAAYVTEYLRSVFCASLMSRLDDEPEQLTRLEAVTKVLRENQGKARKYLKTEIKKRLNLDVSIEKIAQIQQDEGFELCTKKRKSDLDRGDNRELADVALRENFRLTQADYVRVINDAIEGSVSVPTAVRFASEVFGISLAEKVAPHRAEVIAFMKTDPRISRAQTEHVFDVAISNALWSQLRRQLDFGSV